MMCGYPCSGKTTFAQKLEKHLEALDKSVVTISDDSVGVDRNSTYHRSGYWRFEYNVAFDWVQLYLPVAFNSFRLLDFQFSVPRMLSKDMNQTISLNALPIISILRPER